MLLIEVEDYADVRRAVYVFQLVAGELGHHDGCAVNLGYDVKKGYAHVAGHDHLPGVAEGGLEHMVYEGCGGAFALGAGDGKGLVGEELEEDVGLRGDGVEVAASLKFHGGYARRLDDEVVRATLGFVEAGVDLLVVGGNGDLGVRHALLQQGMCAFALAAISGDKNAAVGQKIVKLLLPVHVAGLS